MVASVYQLMDAQVWVTPVAPYPNDWQPEEVLYTLPPQLHERLLTGHMSTAWQRWHCYQLLEQMLTTQGLTLQSLHYERGRPYLIGSEQHYLSMSHKPNWVAAAWKAEERCGLDIELANQRTLAAALRIAQPQEQAWVGQDIALGTLLWTAKEAAWKCLGGPPYPISGFTLTQPLWFEKDNQWQARIHSPQGDELACTTWHHNEAMISLVCG